MDHMHKEGPDISVVLVVGERRKRSSEALQSVLRQEGLERAEVIVVDAGGDEVEPLVDADSERVRCIAMEPGTGFGQLKAEGARQARAPNIAYLEDHVVARRGWLQGLLGAFEEGWDAVGVEVHNANPGVGIGDAVGWINYGLWAPPLEAGEAEMLAGNNTAYRKDVLLAYGQQLATMLVSDTVLQEKLLRDGGRLYAEPSAAIEHRNPTSLFNGMKAEFLYHWAYGAIRSDVFDWSWGQRAKYIVLAPVIAGLRWLRLVRLIRRRSSMSVLRFVRTAAVALCLVAASVTGQTLGIAVGLRDAERRFTAFELNGPRPTADELRS